MSIDDPAMTNAQKFNDYIECGSFPYIAKFKSSQREARDYLRDIYNSVLLKDIVARLKISDITALESVTKYMFHNIGNIVSATKIANTLKSAGKGVDMMSMSVGWMVSRLILWQWIMMIFSAMRIITE